MSLAWDRLPTVSQMLFSIKIQKLPNSNLNPEFKNHYNFDIQALWLKKCQAENYDCTIAWTKLKIGSEKTLEMFKHSTIIKSSQNHSPHQMWVVAHFILSHWRLITTAKHSFFVWLQGFPVHCSKELERLLMSCPLPCSAHNSKILRSLNLVTRAWTRALSCPWELCRQAEDLEGVEGGGEGDLLRGFVQVSRDHLHRHRQRARLVSLETEAEY